MSTRLAAVTSALALKPLKALLAIDAKFSPQRGQSRLVSTAVREKSFPGGELTKKLVVTVDRYSDSAKSKIEAAGGEVSKVA